MSDDLHKHPHYPITGRGQITLPSGQAIPVTLQDISDSGISVLCDYAIKVGTRCRLVFSVADADGRHHIDVSSVIRNEVLSHGKQRLGLQFVEVSADMREQIEAVVARRCAIMTGR